MNDLRPISNAGSPGLAVVAVNDLEPVTGWSDRWQALGEDPQFLLTPRAVFPVGWCLVRLAVRRISGVIANPVLYVDYGVGFEERSCTLLAHGELDGLLTALIRFERPARGFRFDPSDQLCEFDLENIEFRALRSAQAIWHLLRVERSQWGSRAPVRFSEFVREARVKSEASGEAAAIDWVHDVRADAVHPTRYLRWIGNAERPLDDQGGDASSLCIVMLAHAGIRDAIAAYHEVLPQLDAADELLIPASLAAQLAGGLPQGVRVLHAESGSFPGLAESRARFVTWLGPCERLHPRALATVRRALAKQPEVRFAYTDEDFIDSNGERCSPYFKPQWDRELLAGQDYPARSVVIARELAQDYAPRLDGEAWLYATSLEVAEDLRFEEILHIPAVTRHHLHAPGPLHAPLHADGIALAAPMREALRRWQAVRYPDASVNTDPVTALSRLVWPVPERVKVDIVIPTRDRVDLLATCVDSILRMTTTPAYTVIILDNGSCEADTLAYMDAVSADPRVRVVRHDVPFNYSAINNHAVAQGDGDVVVLLNNDIEVVDGRWLEVLVGLALRPGVGAVGAKLLYPDRTLQHAGVLLGVGAVPGGVAAHAHAHLPSDAPGYFGRAVMLQTMSAVTAACLAVSRRAFESIGGLDTSLAVAFNDVDFCLRLREAGFTNLWTPHAVLVHHESASRGYEDTPEKQARFVREVHTMIDRWATAFASDPAYSPNLALSPKEFTVDPDRYARP